MQIAPEKYYDHSKWSDTFTLSRMALETYFANNVFRSTPSRVIYASSEYAFRQRLNLLSKNGTTSISELNLPFMRYYRTGNFQVDTARPGVQGALAGMEGYSEEALGFQNLRFLQMLMSFNCTAYFNRDDDAQMAYECLQFVSTPAPQQFAYGSVDYKGYALDIPMLFDVKDLQWMPSYNETEWLQKAHIIPIDFTVNWRTAILSQKPQTPESQTFWEDEPLFITERVYLDFLSYKFQNSFYDQSNYNLEVEGTFNADPELYGIVDTQNITTTSMYVTWTFNPLATEYYNENVIVNVNGAINYTIPLIQGQYLLEDLVPGSLYNITVWFTSTLGQVTKYTTSATTDPDSTTPVIQGIKGYT